MSDQSSNIVGIIPARLQSTRLPRKLLLCTTGKPLLQHTWEAARRANSLSQIIVATDSEEIADAVESFGGRIEMTGEHPSGTDRIAEVVRRACDVADIIVNIQGDEPELDPRSIDQLVREIVDCPDAQMSTLATPITTEQVLSDPSCTKVVRGSDGRALYFSRSTIPFCRDQDSLALLELDSPWLLHIGVYAYRREFLLRLTQLPPSKLEQLEKLEQLRALEIGARIQVGIVEHHAPGIDTPDDYQRFADDQCCCDGTKDG